MDNPYAGNSNQPDYNDRLSSVDVDHPGDRIPFLKAIFAFFFAPGEYMKRNGVHASETYLALVIWFTGVALVISRFQSDISLGRTRIWRPESWIELLIVALIGGAIRGLVVYGLGGWWYRVRLSMCGVSRNEWSQAARVYMLSGVAKQLSILVFTGIGALSFPSFLEYAQNEDGVMVFVNLIVIVVLIMWSSFTLYFGTKAVFPVKKIWAMLWFLILPLILRVVGLAALFVGAYLMALNPEPDLATPDSHTSSSFSFEYPSNWFTQIDTEVPGPETWVQVEPYDADAFIQFTIYSGYEGQDQIEASLTALTQEGDFTLISEDKAHTQLAGVQGRGNRYTVELDGNQYVLDLFVTPLGENAETLTMIICHKDVWDTVKPGFWHIIRSLEATDPDTLTPNLNRTYTAEGGDVSFEIPSNWWLDTQAEPDSTNEDGTVTKGAVSIRTMTPGFGYFQLYTFTSDAGPRGELGISLDDFTDTGRLIDEEDLDEWFGFTGFGVDGVSPSDDDMTWETKILVAKLPDGRLIEFRSVYPQEHADTYLPGFELIERTFTIDTD